MTPFAGMTAGRYQLLMRWRRLAKWTGLCLSVVMLALFLTNGWWGIAVCFALGQGRYEAGLFEGRCYMGGQQLCSPANDNAISIVDYGRTSRPGWPPSWPNLNFRESFVIKTEENYTEVPLQLAILCIVVPTMFLWHVDRRKFPPGNCSHCGYNLTGNTSGICPEYGCKSPDRQITKSQI